jgi:hypothetical protein
MVRLNSSCYLLVTSFQLSVLSFFVVSEGLAVSEIKTETFGTGFAMVCRVRLGMVRNEPGNG